METEEVVEVSPVEEEVVIVEVAVDSPEVAEEVSFYNHPKLCAAIEWSWMSSRPLVSCQA